MEAKTLENADRIVLDETSSKKGRKYVTVFINARTHETMFATAGKGMDTLAEFSEHLSAHGGKPENIKEIAMDMSPSFIAGAKARFPAAELTFDKFHVIQMMSSAVDEVRRSESKINPILKGSRWIWLKNPSNLTAGQASELKTLSKENLKTAEAYRIKLTLQDIYRFIGKDARLARIAMEQWIDMAKKSGLKPVMDAAASLAAHIRGVVRHFSTGLTSGVAEGFNSIIQEIKRRARGYRNSANFISMIYLSTAGLDTI
jgi:transposase